MADTLRPLIGVDWGSKWILLGDGSSASFWKGVWYPGIIWDARDMLDFPALKDPVEIERLLIEAAEALRLSQDEEQLKLTREKFPG